MLGLTVDEVLTTTRAVRKRLDFDRPLDPQLIIECLDVGLQAPSGSNAQGWDWMVVTEAAKKAALAELYRRSWNAYKESPFFVGKTYEGDDPAVRASYDRTVDSAQYLADNLDRAPAFLIPLPGRTQRQRADVERGRGHARIDHPGGMELHARGAGAGAGNVLDHAALDA